jgi:hypothetical protein
MLQMLGRGGDELVQQQSGRNFSDMQTRQLPPTAPVHATQRCEDRLVPAMQCAAFPSNPNQQHRTIAFRVAVATVIPCKVWITLRSPVVSPAGAGSRRQRQ